MSAFQQLVSSYDPSVEYAERIGVLMLNLGKRCDLACTHCHQEASPLRLEAMTRAVWDRAIAFALVARPDVVDLTGGAPELHPRIAEMVVGLTREGFRVRVRTNLVSLLSPASHAVDLPGLFAERGVELLASFPSTDPATFEAQRGRGTYDRALEALRLLNVLGYGRGEEGANPRMRLDLAVNLGWTDELRSTADLHDEMTRELGARGVMFDDVVTIANVPVGRFGRALESAGTLDRCLDALRDRFNPDVLPALGCRCGVTVSWDGSLADCDFNLGAGHGCDATAPQTIFDVALDDAGIASVAKRRIRYGVHCVACAAGAGSS